MEIYNGLQYYDIGHLIYDLWLIITVFFCCVLITFLVEKSSIGSNKISWNSLAYKHLAFLIIVVLVLINISSYPIKAGIVVAVFAILFLLKQKKTKLITAAICMILGFGLTLVPLLIAFSYASIMYFINKRNLKPA